MRFRFPGILGAIFLGVSIPTWADQFASNVHAVTLKTTSGTLTGFVAIPANCDAGDKTLANLKTKGYGIRFWTKLDKIKFPLEMLVSTGKQENVIGAADIKTIEWRESPYNGSVLQGIGVPQIPVKTARLLKAAPVFSCAPTYAEKGVYWLSYDPKVAEKELKGICNLPFPDPPSEKDRAPFAKNSKVIEFNFDVD